MSEINELLKQALLERQSMNLNPDGSSLFVDWGGAILPCCGGDAMAMKQYGIGGFGAGADLIVIIILEDIVPGYQTAADLVGKTPAPKQTLTYQGKKYRIDQTTIPPGLAHIALALIDTSKGV